MKIVYAKEAYRLIGACLEVYKEKGPGFLEPVYQECLEIECRLQNLPVMPQQEMPLHYKGRTLAKKYIPDFVAYEKIIVEIKAVSELLDEHRAQLLNYLNATGYRLGLLVNFGHYPGLEHERIVL